MSFRFSEVNSQIRRQVRHVLLAAFVLWSLLPLRSGALLAQNTPDLLDAKTRDLLHEALSGERAKDYVISISRHHRIQGSRDYRAAAQYVLQTLHRDGFSEQNAAIESFPSDGKVHYQTWQSPSGWDIESAELRMLEPYEERIAGYPEIAMSLITYSNPGEATAELVWVGAGTSDADYAGKDVRGKIVLATGYGGAVHRKAVLQYGAKAVVCYLADERAIDHPDMLQYTGMWPRTDELDRVTFGFNISNRQGEKLRRLLAAGKRVVVRGTVKGTGLEPYEMDVVVAEIRGRTKPEEEIVFTAHLDHPKEAANDNASGSAALMDIALTLRRLIGQGRLPQPERTLRFLWVPEWNGTMAYIDRHPELAGPALGGKILANLNLDMVGENLEMIHTKMILTRTPASIPSIMNEVVANMAAMVDRMHIRTARGSRSLFNYRMTSYSGGSDHMMLIDRKVPGIMFGHSPDYTHHTSDDTPDRVDPVELERSEIIASGAALFLASLQENQAMALLDLASASASRQVGLAFRRAHALIGEAANHERATALYEAANIVARASTWAGESMASVLPFCSTPAVRQHVETHKLLMSRLGGTLRQVIENAARKHGHSEQTLSRPPWPRDTRVPVRLTRGPLDFGLPASKLPPDAAAWYASPAFALSGDERFELVNFIDGHRSVAEIRDLLSAEFRPTAQDMVAHYLDDLVKVGVLKWM